MSRYLSFGDNHVGAFCGERIFSIKSWRRNKLFKKSRSGVGFSIGPILFWKEKI